MVLPKKSKNATCVDGSVYLLGHDEPLLNYLSTSLEQSSYRVGRFTELGVLETACKNKTPIAIILDVEVNNANDAIFDEITKFKEKIEDCPPIFFISKYEDIEVRLAAVRSGVSHYFCEPLDSDKLVEAVDGLVAPLAELPFRILLIDDDESLLNCYASILREAGMIVETISNPLECLEKLAVLKPDVVVMDVCMPECTGPELVQVIRQDKTWEFLPIVYLSTEADLNSQLVAMKLGADDYLTKPVRSLRLVSVLTAMAKRARKNIQLHKDLESSLREGEFQLTTMNQHDIVSTADVAGRILHVNEKFCEISGFSREELIGENHRLLKSGRHPDSFYKEMWETISQGKVWRGTICNSKKNGSEYWVESTIVPFLDDRGKPYKYVSARTDVTAFRESGQRLSRSQEFANIGTWDWNISTGDLYWSDRIWSLFGYDEKITETNYDNFLNAIHPDDKEDVVTAMNNCVTGGDNYNVEHRVVWPDGSIHWVHEKGDVVRDKDGKPLHMLGVVQDITERQYMQEQMRQQKKLLDMLHRSTNDFVEKGDISATMTIMLNDLLQLTGSEYGFAGEIIVDDDGSKYLKIHSITNVSWDKQSQELYESSKGKGLEFRNMDTLFGQVIETGESIISNSPVKDSRAGGLPKGHPEMNSFLGTPIYYGGQLVGMYGIANRANGYDESLQGFLRPYDMTYSVMINSMRIMNADKVIRNELVAAKEDAINANNAKSEFLSSMSHELRTPMNAIMGFSQLLKIERDPDLSPSQKENVDEIVRAGDHLLELINEVLDLSKIESGRIDLSLEMVVLGDVLNEALQLITPLALKRGIDISVVSNGADVDTNKVYLQHDAARVDRTRMRQVLLNLLSNSVKYNTENGKVTISFDNFESENSDKFMRISISDTGPGLAVDQQSQLFQPFNRLGAEQSDIEGTGIGLVITKNIVELMGGTLGVTSEPGIGSTFWLEMPCETVIVDQNLELDDVDSSVENIIRSTSAAHSVLYIEDNPANLRLVSQLLRRQPNICMWSAHEPLLGLELAEEHKPDLVLLDINLPGMDGFEVLEQLRKRKSTSATPVIAISANAMPADIERGLEAGFDDYITKPINVKTLIGSVNKALDRSV